MQSHCKISRLSRCSLAVNVKILWYTNNTVNSANEIKSKFDPRMVLKSHRLFGSEKLASSKVFFWNQLSSALQYANSKIRLSSNRLRSWMTLVKTWILKLEAPDVVVTLLIKCFCERQFQQKICQLIQSRKWKDQNFIAISYPSF